MNAAKNPTSRHLCEYFKLKERSMNSSVVLNEQNRQAVVEFGLVRYPPAREIYGSMYCEHVRPLGGLMVEYSTSEQVISCPPSPECHPWLSKRSLKQHKRENGSPLPINSSTRYVYGERRYTHFHHPRCLNGCNTPLLFRNPSAIEKKKNTKKRRGEGLTRSVRMRKMR